MSSFARLLFVAFLPLALCSAALAERGDVFLSVGPALEPQRLGEPAFGGAAGVSFGVNELTDFQLEADWTANAGYFDDKGSGGMFSRLLFVSYFTPYMGEIRPRFGGSFGLLHIRKTADDVVCLDLGLHVQALYQATDALRLFAEAVPDISIGSEGGFSTVFKAGLQFRLSK
jgi:hypothetical protein